MRIGPRARIQLAQLSQEWPQGDHVLITGGTGSGKTRLARELDEIRIKRGSHVVVLISKLRPDDTIRNDYRGWTRWTEWKRKPNAFENRILLWPKVEGLPVKEATALMLKVFSEALDEISRTGFWTVHVDEGLFVTSPSYLNLGRELGMMYALMRTSKATMITLAQRPSHLPLSVYANASHAFIGRAAEVSDLKRLANLDAAVPAKELAAMIQANGKHDFIWVSMNGNRPPERINLAE
jgi:energy-coupling factor transporter ATP-binding protein EcfA2